MYPLCYNNHIILFKLERVKGIEPSQPAWKAGTLPLSYTRMVVEDGGFEPPKAMLTDLQSAPFGRSGNPPRGAGDRNRTYNLLITSQLLYR